MKILFWLAKNKRNKRGQIPIFCRITTNGERAEISTNIWILEKDFDNRYKKVRHSDILADSYNKTLLSITTKLNKIYHNAAFLDDYAPNAKHIKEEYKKNTKKRTTHIKSIIKEYITNKHPTNSTEAFKKDNRYATLVLIALTSIGFLNCSLSEYNDYVIDKLAHEIINERKYSIGYCKKTISFFKSSLIFAYNRQYSTHFPNFTKLNYRERTNIIYLSDAEIKRLSNYRFDSEALNNVRDCFLIQCYTGLAFIDMKNLNKENILFEQDGLWINKVRQKVKTAECNIPLAPNAVKILQKYDFKLPIVSNQKYNTHLKTIASLLGINKKLTSHVGRKTYATYLLNKDVPIETVSALLGHSNISITQKAYAKVLHMKIAKDIRSVF
ncbi:site-specific integrase [Saccharicrinis aurantiacus]|uniref:site-specific integrase n=1 Tax=Saccharicrinis aurantiacus TaxID=1849719 RepID=UPI00094FC8BD|nr:site-specific integrase [Saccharicrinis aurantiacus]